MLLMVAPACTKTQTLHGPPVPEANKVSRVVVTPLTEGSSATVISDRARIEGLSTSFAFSESGWSAGEERNLEPVYRIDFDGDSRATYWLGQYPPPTSVPVYFYSTWWVSPSTGAGAMDRTRIKVLADTVRFKLFGDLGL